MVYWGAEKVDLPAEVSVRPRPFGGASQPFAGARKSPTALRGRKGWFSAMRSSLNFRYRLISFILKKIILNTFVKRTVLASLAHPVTIK